MSSTPKKQIQGKEKVLLFMPLEVERVSHSQSAAVPSMNCLSKASELFRSKKHTKKKGL